MIKGFLVRNYFPTHVFGWLIIGGETFRTLERPWLDNQRNVSCIPTGDYNSNYLHKSGSGKYRKVWHVQPVNNRSGILIHNGNLVNHTRGCLLLGNKIGKLAGQPAVLQSRQAMRRLLDLVGPNPFELEVVGV